MKPYYEHAGITIYLGDARDLVAQFQADAIITDPVWPNSIFPHVEDPEELLSSALHEASVERVVVHIGCDSDPRFLRAVHGRWKFIRSCNLDYAKPNYKGRILYGGDVAYVFGEPPPPIPRGEGLTGMKLLPGRFISTRSDPSQHRKNWNGSNKRFTRNTLEYSKLPHPCPRRLEHVQWLVKWFGGGSVLDPFGGSGTTALACKKLGIPCTLIEIEERFCELAANRLQQEVFLFEESES